MRSTQGFRSLPRTGWPPEAPAEREPKGRERRDEPLMLQNVDQREADR